MDTIVAAMNMVFGQEVKFEEVNLTSVIRTLREFSSYVNSPRQPDLDWSVFKINNKWLEVFEETQFQGRLNV